MAADLQLLSDFPPVPAPGLITLFEAEARLNSHPSDPYQPTDCTPFTDVLKDYHSINAKNMKPIFPYKNAELKSETFTKSFVVPENQGFFKGLWTSMLEMDKGLQGVQEYLQHMQRTSASERVEKIFSYIYSLYVQYERAKLKTIVYLYPHIQMGSQDLIAEYAPVREWGASWTKAIVWHPSSPKLAIALQDDTIRIFTVGNNVVPMLRSEDQEMVTSIAFRPFLTSEIAVGVVKGVLIWEIPSSFSIKPRRSQSKLFTANGHSPVTCVNYSNDGNYLLSSSSMDNSILIWLRTLSGYETLHRMSGGGVPKALWSPDDRFIFSTTPSSIFRLWEAQNSWIPRQWSTRGKPVEAACWSPCSDMLMFACDSCLYIVHLQVSDFDKLLIEYVCTSKIVPVFDLRQCLAVCEDGQLQYKVGGRVRQLLWDKTGTRVVLFFEDSELISVFRVQPRAVYFLDPVGFIRGHVGEYPLAMAFQNGFNDGALLVIAWNSGRVQYFPMIFVTPKTHKNIFHIDNYKLRIPINQKPQTMTSPVFNTEHLILNSGNDYIQHEENIAQNQRVADSM